MVAEEQSADDVIDLMVAHAVELRSGEAPDDDAFDQTLRWAEQQGYFRPARQVRANAVTALLLREALERRTAQWRHQERHDAAHAALRRAQFFGATLPAQQPVSGAQDAPQGAQNRPITHVLDKYRMSIAGREVTLGDMTHIDWEGLRDRYRATVMGQAVAYARPELVDRLALHKGARPNQPYRQVLSDEEADAVFSCAAGLAKEVGQDLDARIATIVATNPLFKRPNP